MYFIVPFTISIEGQMMVLVLLFHCHLNQNTEFLDQFLKQLTFLVYFWSTEVFLIEWQVQ